MLLLAIDTSGMKGGIALLENEQLLAEKTLALDGRASKVLLPTIDQIFEETECQRQDLKAVAVTLGPGSFTGIRIGLATAQGIAQALDLPVYGVPSLLALAYPVRDEADKIAVVRPARAGEVYLAVYCGRENWGKTVIQEGRVPHRQVPEQLSANGIPLLLEEDHALETLADQLPPSLSRVPVQVSAASLAAAALHSPDIETSPAGLGLTPRMYSPGYRA